MAYFFKLGLLLAVLANYSYGSIQDLGIDFHQSMSSHKDHDVKMALKDERWKMGEKLYKKYVIDNFNLTEEAQIPKIIHHIWLGSSLPQYAKNFRKTWIQFNPSWKFVLWTDHPIYEYDEHTCHTYEELLEYLRNPNAKQFIIVDTRKLDIINSKPFKKVAKNYGEKSDILRYEILFLIGGLYVDTDFECLKPFDEFHHCSEFYTGVSHAKRFVLYNGLIGSAANSPILLETINQLKNRKRKKMDSIHYSGPVYFTECFIQAMKDNDQLTAIPFPVTFFYPWPNTSRFQSYDQAREWIRNESYGLHFWKVSWNH